MTPQPHDFKSAYDAYQSAVEEFHKDPIDTATERLGLKFARNVIGMRHSQTIRIALRLAERVCGDPSVSAIDAAKDEFKTLEKACNDVGERLSWEGGAIVVFKAMISEALKEVENDK